MANKDQPKGPTKHPGASRSAQAHLEEPKSQEDQVPNNAGVPKSPGIRAAAGGAPGGGTRSSPGGHQGGARSSPGGHQEGTGSSPEGTSEGPGAARGALGSARNARTSNLDEYLINNFLRLINIVSAFNKYSIGLIKIQIRQKLIQFYIIPKKQDLINIHAGF